MSSPAPEPRPSSCVVAGAGLAGALMAIYLARTGHRVRLLERRTDPRAAKPERGRSINLALSVRGLHALGEVGLAEAVRERAIPMRGRMIHDARGNQTFQPYGTEADQVIHSVSRLELNRILLDAAASHSGVELRFHAKCTSVDLETATIRGEDLRTRTPFFVPGGDFVVGADGAFSAVRRELQRLEGFDYEQAWLAHGYKELTIPAGRNGTFQMEREALHIWPRGGFMMIALPNRDGSYTCTLFWPLEGPQGFQALQDRDAVRRYFANVFPDALALMPHLADDYFANPTSQLVTIRCRPWHHGHRVVLLGDAAHAVVPFYGQGANAAFEDCVVLDQCLKKHAPNWSAAFADYERQRKPHTDALADLALENFLEMRDKVASRWFLLHKKAEKLLHRAFPRWFIPLYTMVTFTRTPYAKARRRARRQWRVVRWTLGVLALALLVAAVAIGGLAWR